MKPLAAASFLIALSLLSCSTPRAWVYAAEPRQDRAPVVDATLVVPPFADKRKADDNTSALIFWIVPIMPFGWENLSVPEVPIEHAISRTWQFRPRDDLARAFADEIDAARIFRETFTDPRASTGQYVLTGEIRTLSLDSYVISYGLSFYGPLLWLVGLPAVSVGNELELRLTLAPVGGGEPLWQHTIKGSDDHVGWIYALGSDFAFDRLLKEQMPAALASLEQALRAPGARLGG